VVPDVAKALAHENRWERITAARALGKIGAAEAREALTRRLGVERDPKVVEAIRKALEALAPPESPAPEAR
jgi:HEAT repeat protein